MEDSAEDVCSSAHKKYDQVSLDFHKYYSNLPNILVKHMMLFNVENI